jgi:hypothetical protein
MIDFIDWLLNLEEVKDVVFIKDPYECPKTENDYEIIIAPIVNELDIISFDGFWDKIGHELGKRIDKSPKLKEYQTKLLIIPHNNHEELKKYYVRVR